MRCRVAISWRSPCKEEFWHFHSVDKEYGLSMRDLFCKYETSMLDTTVTINLVESDRRRHRQAGVGGPFGERAIVELDRAIAQLGAEGEPADGAFQA